jgi:pyruvate/2-oxoacid:ferredoxin oxidoreductase beta subunit
MRWCPGCGDYAILNCVQGIMAAIGSNPTLGGLVSITRPRLITTDLLQTGDIIAAAAVVVELEYRTAVWQL